MNFVLRNLKIISKFILRRSITIALIIFVISLNNKVTKLSDSLYTTRIEVQGLLNAPEPVYRQVNYDESSFKDSVYQEIKRIHIKFPKVVLAQAMLESGLDSEVLKSNNNLFGMRLAKARPTTAIDEHNGYAVYYNWRESLVDYALYQATYCKGIKSENEYIKYLCDNYCDDKDYAIKLNLIINQIK